MMKRANPVLLLALVSVIALLVAACGSEQPTATPTPTSEPTATPTPLPPGVTAEPTATPTPTATPDASFEAQWQELIEAAQAEGKLIVVGGGSITDVERIYGHFKDKFGIEVVLGRGSSTEHAQRILAEQSAGRYTVDIAHSGASSANSRYIPNDTAAPIEQFIFHPEAMPENWFGDKWWFTDEQAQYHLVYASGVNHPAGSPNFWWNTDRVSVEEVAQYRTVKELVEDNPGEIISLSKLVGGTSSDNLTPYLDPNLGPEWFELMLASGDVFLTSDKNVIEDNLAFGAHKYAVDIGSTELDQIRNTGGPVENLQVAYEEGLVPGMESLRTLDIGSGGASRMVLVLKNPPHPNATKLYLNWLLSVEGQTLINATNSPAEYDGQPHDRISLHRGIPPGSTNPLMRWEEGTEYAIGAGGQPDLRPLNEQVYEWLNEMERCKCLVERPLDPEEYRHRVVLE